MTRSKHRARKFFDKPRKVILTAIGRTLKFFDRSLGDMRWLILTSLNSINLKKNLGFVREPPPTHVKFVSHDNLNSHMENLLNPIFTS